MIFAATTTLGATYAPTGASDNPTAPAACSPALISQRNTLDAQVRYDLEKVQAALVTNKAQLYSTTFMRFATNTRTLARLNGALDACDSRLLVTLTAPLSTYTTQRRKTYQDLILAEFKLNELWAARKYSAWLRQLRSTAGLHRTLAKIDAIIARIRRLALPPPPVVNTLPNNGNGFTTNPQTDHHEVDDGYNATPGDSALPSPPQPEALPPSTSSDEPVPVTEPPVLFEPIWKRRWFWPVVGITAAVTGAGLLLRRH